MRILIIDDNPYDAELSQRSLNTIGGIRFDYVEDFTKFKELFSPGKYEAVISDYALSDCLGTDVLLYVKELEAEIPFIIVSGTLGEEAAIRILRLGATDYVLKDSIDKLPLALLRALKEAEGKKATKSTRQKLEESEKRFRALIEKSSDIKTLITIDGKILYGSPSLTLVLGYPIEEYVNRSIVDFIHPDDISRLMENRIELLQTPGKSFYDQLQLRHKNGSWVWCEGNVTNLLPEAGVNALVSNFRDISEKKIAERQMEFDRNNLNALINNTKDLMWSVDRDFKLITSNKSFDELVMLMSGHFKSGRNILETGFSLENVYRYKKFYERAFAGETFTEIEHFLIPFEFWSEISYYPIRKGDEVIGTACYSRDITELKKKEKFLLQSKEKLKEAQTIAHIGNLEIDMINNIHIWSDEMYNIFGVKRNEVIPSEKVFLSFIHPEDKAFTSKKMEEAFSSLTDSSFNFRFIGKDGFIRYGYTEYKFELDQNGKPIRLFGIVQDITEMKKAEKEILLKNKQLRDLSQHLQKIREEERTHIAREIHDELGQQVTALKMDIDWVSHKQDTQDGIVVSKLQEMLGLCDEIIGSVRRISSDLRPGIIDDLGLIAALEWKCNDFEAKMGIPCQFSSSVKERKFENHFSINTYRILQETLTNVARHAAANSVTVSLSENETELLLEITDDGKGFGNENISNKKTLGIVGMKERAALLGGELTITGAPNKGTQIKLILPLKK